MNRVMEPPVMDMLRELASDGGRWAHAEMRLMRAEGRQVLRRGLLAAAAALVGVALVVTAAGIFADAGILALAPHLGAVYAALVMAAVVLALACLCMLSAYQTMLAAAREPKVFRRWSGTLRRLAKPVR